MVFSGGSGTACWGFLYSCPLNALIAGQPYGGKMGLLAAGANFTSKLSVDMIAGAGGDKSGDGRQVKLWVNAAEGRSVFRSASAARFSGYGMVPRAAASSLTRAGTASRTRGRSVAVVGAVSWRWPPTSASTAQQLALDRWSSLRASLSVFLHFGLCCALSVSRPAPAAARGRRRCSGYPPVDQGTHTPGSQPYAPAIGPEGDDIDMIALLFPVDRVVRRVQRRAAAYLIWHL
ncbi:hypothetical protein E2562_014068 [Oryza meyeriana var. granulata]|uniref:Uncharacterized protein n=1 Tax=Oryza meyeriana var. granulata TaxID=110450 RepID=A0A6G1DJ32_9ORYZ|nr:hypothetical protein E2562_014068 [Oryza meyeriana var. granulata]